MIVLVSVLYGTLAFGILLIMAADVITDTYRNPNFFGAAIGAMLLVLNIVMIGLIVHLVGG